MGNPRTVKRPAFIAVDFFCGAGGTTRGLIDAGGYVLAGVDHDPKCAATYVGNNRNMTLDRRPARYFTFDIRSDELITALDPLIAAAREANPNVPLAFAICAPCQPFTTLSRAGLSNSRRLARERDRGLLAKAARFVERYRPELIMAENVSGIRDPRYGGVWQSFERRLRRNGYAVGSEVVCASKFGVPQIRKRSILLAVRKDLVREPDLDPRRLLVPSHDPGAAMVTVGEAIGHLPAIKDGETHPRLPNHRARHLSDLNKRRLAAAKPGESNAYMETTRFGDLSLRCHRAVNSRQGERCFNDVYTRMRADKPAPTMTTKCISPSNGRFGHYDIKQVRGISLLEASLLQSFPQNYVFHPTDRNEPVARQIGNAVPPLLARFMAKFLVQTISVAGDGRPVKPSRAARQGPKRRLGVDSKHAHA